MGHFMRKKISKYKLLLISKFSYFSRKCVLFGIISLLSVTSWASFKTRNQCHTGMTSVWGLLPCGCLLKVLDDFIF